MSPAAWQLAFNLLVNGAFSFLVALAIVLAARKLFRVGTSRWALFLLSLPFLKIVWDLAAGVPSTSILMFGIDPLALPEGHKAVKIGAGLSQFGPVFNILFSVRDLVGLEYSASAADLVQAWLARLSPAAPAALVSVIVGVAGARLAARAFEALSFERNRGRDRKGPGSRGLRRVRAGLRTVDVYASSGYSGSPFTGGIFRPYVCIPEGVERALSASERDAVIAHELAHVRSWDLAGSMVTLVIADLFWFVPGVRWLAREIDRMRELLADKASVRGGTAPEWLASALVRVAESGHSARAALAHAFFSEQASLKGRVALLCGIGAEPAPRLGWNHGLVRAALVFWITGAVLIASVGGNYEIEHFPYWLASMVNSLGLNRG